MIQMETSLFEARCCLRTPLKGPSPGINQWPRPRAGVAEVAPRSEASGWVPRGGPAGSSAPCHAPTASERLQVPAHGTARAFETYPVKQTDPSPTLGFMTLG